MNHAEFEALVVQALDSLPEEFKQKLNNVDVVIEELPTQAQLNSLKIKHPLFLFGLYQGIPQTKRGIHYSFVAPDKITIFKTPIEFHYKTPEKIKNKVRSVVLHEIGHHFGMSEADLARHDSTR